VPEGVKRDEERENGDGQNVLEKQISVRDEQPPATHNDKPSYHLETHSKDEDDSLQTIDSAQHDDGRDWKFGALRSNKVEQPADVCHRDWGDKGRDEVDEDDEAHREAAHATEGVDEEQLKQIVDCRVDPAPSLRKQNFPAFWSCCQGSSVSDKGCLVRRKSLQQKRCEITVFSQVQQVLQVKRIDDIERERVDDRIAAEERLLFERLDSKQRETSRQTATANDETCAVSGRSIYVTVPKKDSNAFDR
jgi:hypothetical protein